MKSLLIIFTFFLVFTVSLTPAAMAADYPPTASDSENTNPGKNPVDEIKKATKDSSYYGTAKSENARTPYENYNGGFDGTAEAESIKMWFCGNNPFGNTSQGAGAYSYMFDGRNSFNATAPGSMDQNDLRQSVIQKCMKAEKYIDWHTTDTVYVVIFAPGFNEDSLKTDYIGNKQYNEIFCTSDASPTVGMWSNEGGRDGAGFGYQSWIADNGGTAFHKSIYQNYKKFGSQSNDGTVYADRSQWKDANDFYPGYMQWWSNHDNASLAAVKGIKEIGTDTGVFAGSVSLSGIKRFIALPEKYSFGVINGDYNKQFTSGSDRGFSGAIGSKICSIQTDRTGAFTIAWEYSEDKFVSKTAYYTMKEGEVNFGDDYVTMDQQVSVVLKDRDVSSRPWDSTPIEVHVWSDSDKGGIQLELRHERDWWVMQADDQTFYGTLFLSSDQESLDQETSGKGGIRCYKGECYERGSARLHAQPGDHIYVHYKDYTLPKPYGIDGCTMTSADWTIDDEPFKCDHIDIYNFAKVKEANPLSDVALTKVSILPYEKPKVEKLNEINDDIRTYERLVQTEEQRIESMGYEPSKENMSEYSFKYDGLIAKIIELEDDTIELKTRLADYKLPQSSKTFVENDEVKIIGTFVSTSYAPNQFVFAVQAEHVETGQVDYVGMSQKTNVTKKKSVDVQMGWTPKIPGEYILKLYVMDGSTMGAVLKNPIINHIHIESTNTNLAFGPDSAKN
ncbi:hypothetical protein OAJ34_01270 [Candidatus Nitrosopelagicus sp.]|nr:hypothetical protein [Candidatus Nitrosopelagicus sp.]